LIKLITQSTTLTLKEARGILGMSMKELAEAAGVSIATISSVENGGPWKTREDSAELLAGALGMTSEEICWPRGRSNRGRPAQSGKCITTSSAVTSEKKCPKCFLILPLTNRCDDCT
jgi:DNA-binding XRE family transcriptional regulator